MKTAIIREMMFHCFLCLFSFYLYLFFTLSCIAENHFHLTNDSIFIYYYFYTSLLLFIIMVFFDVVIIIYYYGFLLMLLLLFIIMVFC